MSNRDHTRREALQSARPPEYIIIRKQSGARSEAQRNQPSPKKIRQRKREAQLEDHLSRRAELREQRFEATRRRQWVMAVTLIVLLIALIVLARLNT